MFLPAFLREFVRHYDQKPEKEDTADFNYLMMLGSIDERHGHHQAHDAEGDDAQDANGSLDPRDLPLHLPVLPAEHSLDQFQGAGPLGTGRGRRGPEGLRRLVGTSHRPK